MSFLQPNLMTTEELRNHLKKVRISHIIDKKNRENKFEFIQQRFPNQNVPEHREELLRLFSLYAEPKARRTASNPDVEMKPAIESNPRRENENKRPRHQMITAPTVETVTNACKRIRLINTERVINQQKRQCETSPMVWI